MKRDVSPILGVVLILLALTAVQVFYWRGLGTASHILVSGSHEGSRGEGASAPTGLEEVTVTTVAGRPEAGHRYGRGDEARFDGPAAVAVGAYPDVYVADSRNHCVEMVEWGGQVCLAAGGTGKPGYSGDGQLPSYACFSAPAGLAVSPDGSLLVADTGNHRIRRISNPGGPGATLRGSPMVTTIAGSATPRDDLGRELGGYRDGPALQAQFCYPVGLAVDEGGAVYVADAGNHRVRRISPAGQVTTIPTEGLPGRGTADLKAPTALALTPDGQLWVADTAAGALWVGPRQGPLHQWQPAGEARLAKPAGIAVLAQNAAQPGIYVSDAGNHCLWRIDGDQLTLIAGKQDPAGAGWGDGPGNEALFSCPAGLAAGPDGALYVADFGNNCLRRVSLTPGRPRQVRPERSRRAGRPDRRAGGN
jgi:DNA-binding beta-propeller fold protein YncE